MRLLLTMENIVQYVSFMLTHTNTHTHTDTHTSTPSLSHTHTHMYTHVCTQTLTHWFTYMHTLSLSLSHTHTHTNTHTLLDVAIVLNDKTKHVMEFFLCAQRPSHPNSPWDNFSPGWVQLIPVPFCLCLFVFPSRQRQYGWNGPFPSWTP